MRLLLALVILSASVACGVPTAPDSRIATGAGAAPKGCVLPPVGELRPVAELECRH